MRYRVQFDASLEHELAKIDSKTVARILSVIESLAENPRPPRCLKLKGKSNLYRVRVGNFRVIYAIEDSLNLVAILRVGDRKDAYR
ncbi:MAG: type II toxin-antitoxin system RelE/ParE family toxin [Candidatus Omnitrophota bacterium]